MNIRLLASFNCEILEIKSAFPWRKPLLELPGKGEAKTTTAPVWNEVRYGKIGDTEERSVRLCPPVGQNVKGNSDTGL